jgi:hypothetical protein
LAQLAKLQPNSREAKRLVGAVLGLIAFFIQPSMKDQQTETRPISARCASVMKG